MYMYMYGSPSNHDCIHVVHKPWPSQGMYYICADIHVHLLLGSFICDISESQWLKGYITNKLPTTSRPWLMLC